MKSSRLDGLIDRVHMKIGAKGMRGRLYVLIITVILFLLGGLVLFSTLVALANITRNRTEQLTYSVSLQGRFIDQWLAERILDIRQLAALSEMKDFDLSGMKQCFDVFLRNQNEFYSMVFVDADGIARIDMTFGPGKDLSDREYFIKGSRGKPYVSDVLIGRNSGRPTVIISHPVYKDGKFHGVVFGPVSLDALNQVVKTSGVGGEGATYLIDGHGFLISSLKIPEHSGETPYLARGSQGRLQPRTRIMEDAGRGIEPGGYYQNYQGLEVMGVYSRANRGRWLVVGELLRSEALRPFWTLQAVILACALLTLVAALSIAYRLARFISRPIESLDRGTELMKSGRYDHRISPDEMQYAPIEVRSLCRSFNLMAETIEQHIARIQTMATTDQLTGVFNRRHLMEQGKTMLEVCQRASQPCSALMIDIDHFKKVNDNYGHPVGDRVLRHVSGLLADGLRGSDLLGRYGGEEFVVVATNADKHQAGVFADRIINRIRSTPFREDGIELNCTVSIGAAEFRPDHDGADIFESMLSEADQALYKAKNNGRNQVVVG
ncbi:MAG: diguanylate cyclase [Proteobacteria bacterium]|nr:diguanylate cyclase [Pseudomonadota bacterium]